MQCQPQKFIPKGNRGGIRLPLAQSWVVETGSVYEGGGAIAAALQESEALKMAFEYMEKQNKITDELNECFRKSGSVCYFTKHFELCQNNRWENDNDYVQIRTFKDGVMED